MAEIIEEVFEFFIEGFLECIADSKLKGRSKKLLFVMTLFLAASYVLIRYVCFDLHGMKQWPAILGCAAMIVLVTAFLAGRLWISAASVLGYLCGFGIGLLLNQDGTDAGGGRTNNLWIIWSVSLAVFLLLGAAAEVLFGRKKGKA